METELFEKTVLQIRDIIFTTEQIDDLPPIPVEGKPETYPSTEVLKRIIITVNDGYKKAQDMIIENLLLIQQDIVSKNEGFKEAKRNKSEDVKSIESELKILKYQEKVFKHLADTIFWFLIGGKPHVARRFYEKYDGDKTLVENNIESLIRVAGEINKDPLNFVLITDITTYVQIGDLVGFKDGYFQLIEVKEGDINIDILKDLFGDNPLSTKEILEKHKDDPKMVKQITRMLHQHDVSTKEMALLNNDEGIDPASGKFMTITTPPKGGETAYYLEELASLEKQLSERNLWGYTIIDECLHIGLYKGEKRAIAPNILKEIATGQGKEKVVIVDARKAMDSLECPLFLLPFSKELIMDIVMGRVLMFMMLDLDGFLSLYDYFEVKWNWLSTKKTHQLKEQMGQKDMVLWENKAIEYKTSGENKSVVLCWGSLLKIFFDHIRPAYVAYSATFTTGKAENS